jgi:hypothetical protein
MDGEVLTKPFFAEIKKGEVAEVSPFGAGELGGPFDLGLGDEICCGDVEMDIVVFRNADVEVEAGVAADLAFVQNRNAGETSLRGAALQHDSVREFRRVAKKPKVSEVRAGTAEDRFIDDHVILLVFVRDVHGTDVIEISEWSSGFSIVSGGSAQKAQTKTECDEDGMRGNTHHSEPFPESFNQSL